MSLIWQINSTHVVHHHFWVKHFYEWHFNITLSSPIISRYLSGLKRRLFVPGDKWLAENNIWYKQTPLALREIYYIFIWPQIAFYFQNIHICITGPIAFLLCSNNCCTISVKKRIFNVTNETCFCFLALNNGSKHTSNFWV